MKIGREQTIQIDGKEGDKTVETKLTAKGKRSLSQVEDALMQIPSISSVEDAAMGNTILQDLILLENNASSGSVSLIGESGTGEGFIVLENPKDFMHRLN